MKIESNGLAMAVAKDLLSKYIGEQGSFVPESEIAELCDKMLHNAYVEGYNTATKRISALSLELMDVGPKAKSFVVKEYPADTVRGLPR